MKKIRQMLAGVVIAAGLLVTVIPTPMASAINVFEQCKENADAAVCKSQGDSATSLVQTVINLLLYTLGIISVIMIVIGGVRFTTSNGDPAGVKTARNTVIYSVVGLVVAILSYAIVNLVLGRFISG